MDDHLDKPMGELKQTVAALDKASKQALNLVSTVKYRGVPFHVIRNLVIADMSPLAFFHLIEHIEDDGTEAAVSRLYDRLMPLLTCQHQWTPLRRSTDNTAQNLAIGWFHHGSTPHICKACTAYGFKGPRVVLPRVGMIVQAHR